MERKFHRENKTIELIETLVECIEFWSKLCANGKFFYCGISLPYIYFYDRTSVRMGNFYTVEFLFHIFISMVLLSFFHRNIYIYFYAFFLCGISLPYIYFYGKI
jgi:hypothetical protein